LEEIKGSRGVISSEADCSFTNRLNCLDSFVLNHRNNQVGADLPFEPEKQNKKDIRNVEEVCPNTYAKPTKLAETLPVRRVHQAGNATNPDPALHNIVSGAEYPKTRISEDFKFHSGF
jgi:hypothetical protein